MRVDHAVSRGASWNVKLALFSFLALCASLLPASAQNVNVFANPDQIAKMLQGEGLAAKLDTDSDGDPLIASSSQGLKWNIYFYGCTNGRNCSAVQFSCVLSAKGKIPVEQLNEYNLKWRFTKSYLMRNGSVALVRDVDLKGGVTSNNFKSIIAVWDDQLGDFKKEMGW